MPLVRISLPAGKSSEYRRGVGEAVHRALVEAAKVPPDDRFQVLTEHEPENLICDRAYLGIERTADCLVVQITLNAGRSVEVKQALFRRLADLLHEGVGIRREDVFVSLVEVPPENWSFGNGEAQYAAASPAAAGGAGRQPAAAFNSPALAAPVGPFSHAMVAGGHVFLSGQVGQDPASGKLVATGTADQAEQIFTNLEALLGGLGLTLANVLKANVYLTDMSEFAAVNEVYARRFAPPYPARTTVAVAALPLGARVEIEAVVLAK